MIGELKPYPSTKDTDVPWFGRVPEHWQILPLCAIARIKSINGTKDRELLSVYLDRGVIPFSEVEKRRTNPTSEDLSKYQAVDPGDFVLNNQQAWRGSVGVSKYAGIVSPAYLVLSLSAVIDPAYANLLFRERAMVDQYVICSRGVGSIQRNLYWPSLKRICTLLPPLPEQANIVRFLDHADQHVGRYIRAKQKLIRLLEEERRAIVDRAVTRGIDSDVRLKRSGVRWLGDVPEHWSVIRSRRLFSVRQELARHDDVQLSATQAYGVIPQSEFEQKVGRRVVKISLHLEKRRHVEQDDFVISMRSFQGGLERAWASGCIRSSYVVLKPGPDADVRFFAYLFKSHGYIRALQATANFIRDGQDLNFGNFRLVDLPAVPIQEQKAIADFLEASSAKIDNSINRARAEIDLLREYRSRLVADVVTGKLDVRDAVARLPVGAQEPELLDETEDLPQDESTAEDIELEAEEAA
jgi:type I restriction enzyme S subunit